MSPTPSTGTPAGENTGTPRAVEDETEKLIALSLIVDHMLPGRWGEARRPSAAELRATRVTRLDIEEASAKVRDGGPGDEPDDLALGHIWAGHVPLTMVPGRPVPDAAGPVPSGLPASLATWLAAYEPNPDGKGAGTATRPVRAEP
ncbi:MAG TPA: pyridoxamine 5'-phosphate oxidase family protein [Acidimicrobiales bacterium]|nr:pyridoxamine 5'-phosphate oxidase family protein [Acidimicrobiales bacterium]